MCNIANKKLLFQIENKINTTLLENIRFIRQYRITNKIVLNIDKTI